MFLSTEFDRIVVPTRFSSDRLYNIHFSLLPRYKGMYPSVMPILNGESETGVTLHVIRFGIDTGEIIAQQKIKIDSTMTSYDLYLALNRAGSKLVCDYISRLISGDYAVTIQSSIGSTYTPPSYIDYSNLKFQTRATAYQYQCQVRAFAFRPYQLLTFNGTPIVKCDITENFSTKKPGTILTNTSESFTVSTIDYDVILYKDSTQNV